MIECFDISIEEDMNNNTLFVYVIESNQSENRYYTLKEYLINCDIYKRIQLSFDLVNALIDFHQIIKIPLLNLTPENILIKEN